MVRFKTFGKAPMTRGLTCVFHTACGDLGRSKRLSF